MARYCARMIEEHDADGFEGKVATVALDEEVAMVREVRAAIGPDRELRLDANGGWTVPTAREALRRLDAYDIRYYEDPVETQEEMAALRPATRASFSSHLIDLRKAIALGAPDTIVSNVNEFGGIRRVVEFARACERFDVGFRFHSGETGIGSAAYLHVSAAIASVREPSQTLLRWYADDVIAEGPFVPEGRPAWRCRPAPASASRSIRSRCSAATSATAPRGRFPGGPGAGWLRRGLPPPVSDADQIAAALAAAGTDVCFGVPGGGVNLDLVGACGRHGIRFVLTHTETAAVIAAGVWGELTGRPGLALCTRGPGLAAALNGIAQAHLDRQPVIVVTDGAGFAHPHQRVDHAAMVAPFSKGTVSDPEAAVALALAPPWGPVLIDAGAPVREAPAVAAIEPAPDVVLPTATRPVVLVGVAARGSEEAIRDLVRATGIPVLTTYKAKGAVPESWPNAAGLLTGGTIEAPLLDAADLIVAVGLDPVELIPAPWPYAAPIVSLMPWPNPPGPLSPMRGVRRPAAAVAGRPRTGRLGLGADGRRLPPRDARARRDRRHRAPACRRTTSCAPSAGRCRRRRSRRSTRAPTCWSRCRCSRSTSRAAA